jgi:hypothetical protein
MSGSSLVPLPGIAGALMFYRITFPFGRLRKGLDARSTAASIAACGNFAFHATPR